jgi:hypothetical protein
MFTESDPHTNTLFILDGPLPYNAIRVRAGVIRMRPSHHQLNLIQEEK